MAKVHVTAKRDFIETLTTAKPLAALAEIIWNGFDANANKVQVFLVLNDLKRIETIRIRDFGYGIDHSKIDAFFGNLGDSWKKAKHREFYRVLHGKNGKGRFKAFALGKNIEWSTTYQDPKNNKYFSYKIVGNASTIDDFEISDPAETNNRSTGTEVIIYNPEYDFRSLRDGQIYLELAKIFAVYLTEYPGLILEYDGIKVDPQSVQSNYADYPLGDVEINDGKTAVTVSIIEWNIPTDRVIHLCDAKGISLYEYPIGTQIRAPGFNFTAYIKSDHFRELDKQNELSLVELHPDIQQILKIAKNKIKEHFRHRTLENKSKIVEQWKEDKIYPYEEALNLDPIETAERQVFEILAVNVQSYLPSFEDSDQKSKKFTFRLLAQAIRENPESVQEIISEVLGLKKEQQNELADLLNKTSLSSIISSAKIVANRLNFLIGLEDLVFEKESKQKLLERDQLHKILENEAWLFHEEFALAGSEQRLEDVLSKHLKKLGKREDDLDPVEVGEGKTGRVDLMLSKVTQPRSGEYDYLIVELKRPLKKIDDEVITQIKKYANAVAEDERFHGIQTKWTFIAVSNELDKFAKSESNQRNRPRGLVLDNAELNITVWVKTWADVINDARARLRFFNEQLAYEADQESSKAYLKKTHAKYIPDTAYFSDCDSDDE